VLEQSVVLHDFRDFCMCTDLWPMTVVLHSIYLFIYLYVCIHTNGQIDNQEWRNYTYFSQFSPNCIELVSIKEPGLHYYSFPLCTLDEDVVG
jgi:hypothetical protein